MGETTESEVLMWRADNESREHQYRMQVAACQEDRALFLARPSVMLGLVPKPDGNQWCALYGENIQDGVAGFGDSPNAAMQAFDVAWKSAPADPNG